MTRGAVTSALVAVVVVVTAACYSPSPIEGQPCSETQRCPRGLTCDIASLTCLSEIIPGAKFASISGGESHACAIDTAGALFCWGRNDSGELGVGDYAYHLVPTRVGTETDWRTVGAGENSTCALRLDGSLWCWGFGGMTGLSDTDTPRRVGSATYKELAVGQGGYCALGTDDIAVCKFTFASSIGDVGGAGFPGRSIAASVDRLCIIGATDGALRCWGANNRGQAGDGTVVDVPTPTVVAAAPTAWTTVKVGDQHTCAIAADGGLWCWGRCFEAQTGIGIMSTGACAIPRRVGIDTYTAVAGGPTHTCAVRADGAAVCVGENGWGQLGQLGGTLSEELLVVPGIDDWLAVTAGWYFSCGLRTDGEAWCWGSNTWGELGDGTGGTTREPALVDPGPWRTVATGSMSTCGIRTDGSLWCWGRNDHGQIGDGSRLRRHVPVQVGTDRDWTTVTTGLDHTCGLRAGGLWCWGANTEGQLGTNLAGDELVPTLIGTRTDWTEVAASDQSTCGVRAGELWCWGLNYNNAPSRVSDEVGWSSISTHNYSEIFPGHYHAIRAGGMYYWFNSGPNTTPDDATVNWAQVTVGFDHDCGLDVGGALWCLGTNSAGELGNGMISVNSSTPTREVTLQTWSRVGAGRLVTCGITTEAKLYCWGDGDLLGIGSANDTADPVEVLPGTTWTEIDLDNGHTCGIRTDGSLWCWGQNHAGELGIGGGGSDRPVRVRAPN